MTRSMRGVIAGTVLLASLLTGCAGEGLLPTGGLSTEPPPSATQLITSSSAGSEKPAFNPFAGPGEGGGGGRVVITDPSREEVMAPGPLPERAIGRADAPVTIIKYASMTCPYCRKFHAEAFPELKRAYIDTGKVRFILREFPIGHQSGMATIALRCAPESRYFELYGKLMAQQPAWVSQEVRVEPIAKVAAQVGLTRAQLDACIADPQLVQGLRWVKDRGRSLGIIGTPNFFIDGKLVKSVIGMNEIRAMIDPILAARAAGKS